MPEQPTGSVQPIRQEERLNLLRAIALGRKWLNDLVEGTCPDMLAHLFDNGARYTDYVVGDDRAAEYGIAGLVASAIGVKLVKRSSIGAVPVFVKKFAIVLVLPFIYAWRKIAALLKRKPSQMP